MFQVERKARIDSERDIQGTIKRQELGSKGLHSVG